MEIVITFKNTGQAIKAESCLLGGGLNPAVMPLPGEIAAGCGLCLRLASEHLQPAVRTLQHHGVQEIQVYARRQEAGRWQYSPMKEVF